jgi:alkane 1-monooxygenase
MFLIPLYAYVIAMFATHVWCIMLYSGLYDGQPGFKVKPETILGHVTFTVVISFFGGISSIAGHELVHHKEWYNKAMGTLPYTQFCYSHFWDEHTRGHHKYISTPEDPVSHDIGTDLYTAVAKAVVLTHVKTWEREQDRLSNCNNPIQRFASNRMVHYFLLHTCILGAVYYFFGSGGLKFHAAFIVTGLFWMEVANYLEHYGL